MTYSTPTQSNRILWLAVLALAGGSVACSSEPGEYPASIGGGVATGTGGSTQAVTGSGVTGGVAPTGTGGGLVPNTGGSQSGGASSVTGGASGTTGGSGNGSGGIVGHTGGSTASGGRGFGTGGTTATGGHSSNTGGTVATGGRDTTTGGTVATGGRASDTGGPTTTGGRSSNPSDDVATGGRGFNPWDMMGTGGGGFDPGGNTATGGSASTGGEETGGSEEPGGAATAGAGSGDSTGEPLNCSAPMPTSGGTSHCGSYRTGRAGDLSWELWSNSYSGSACITYYDVPAFSAQWNNNGDYLARLGIEWGGKSIAQLGEITAEFAYTKTGSGGGYSYIGVYGWATSPCVEYYIIDDSFNGMPFNPWGMQEKGSADIDGEKYKFYSGNTNGTGGSRCAGGGSFQQYWSVRQTGRQCGVMTITKHFEEWSKVGMNMDNILEAKILVETGGGQGTVEFPVANVKSSQ